MVYKFLFNFFIFFVAFNKAFGYPLVTVNTTRGTVIGFHEDQGNDTNDYYGQGDIFLGIPFAFPPVGNLRYKFPRPIVQFPTQPYNATYYRKECIQPNDNMTRMSEDCLYVNVWTPNAASTTKYPVLLWIHGGGLVTGSSHLSTGPVIRNYLTKGLVVASMEYRMGWLGYFTTFTNDFPPNLGSLDQVLALKFIKEEISYFAGDPMKITIFGQSAGGFSVSSHTYRVYHNYPDLFQQAIMESGTVLTCYEDATGLTYKNFNFAHEACGITSKEWDAGNFTSLIPCLMNLNVENGTFDGQRAGAANGECWNMVQDNYFFPGNPQTLYKTRPNIPAIIGNCKDEKSFTEINEMKNGENVSVYTREVVEKRLFGEFYIMLGPANESKAQQVMKIWEDAYLQPGAADDDHLAWLNFIVAVNSPAYFTMASLRDIEYYVENNNPSVYTYEFDWSSPISNDGNPLPYWHPVPHTCEISYVLSYGNTGNWDATNQALANLIQNNWANFAKTGKPTTDGSWQPTTSKNFSALEYFEFNNVSTQKVGFRATDQKIWNEVLPTIVGEYPPNLPKTYSLCTKGYQSKVKNTICYEAFGTVADWNTAQNNCAQNSYGSLVTVNSAFENSDLLTYAKNAFPQCTGFYIGLFKSPFIPNNANWTWLNYDPSGYRNWQSEQRVLGFPVQGASSNCVVLNKDGTWKNQGCDMQQCYVCAI